MKQQLAYKILAAFLVLTMLGSVFAYFFIGSKEDITKETLPQDTNKEKYNEELWKVDQPFYSISDSLSMTPQVVDFAYYVDLEGMTPQMSEWTKSQDRFISDLIQEVDTKLYKSNTVKLYYAQIKEGNDTSFLLLSTMYPQKNDFDYIVLPNMSYVLQRQDTGAINIMGTPVIYAPGNIAGGVLNILNSLNKSGTAYDQYEYLLEKTEPVPYQMVTSNVSFARQFYLGIGLENGSYVRTTIYLDANSSVLNKLDQSKANSSQKGFEQYNINKSGNITIVKIASPELFKVLSEESS